MRKYNPLDDPIGFGLVNGIVGGITFAVFGTVVSYYRYGELQTFSIFGGVAWFIASMALSFYIKKIKNKK